MIRLLLSILFTILLINCTTSKVIEVQITKNVQLNLIDLYCQEIVPGQKNKKTTYDVCFKLGDSQVQIDSLVYNSKSSKVNRNKNGYRFNLNENLLNKEVAIYYQKKEVSYFSKHQIIKILEPIYQP